MKVLSAVLVRLSGEPAFFCPGCRVLHRVNVHAPRSDNGARWTWNGDTELPSFSPSLDVQGWPFRCHSRVELGHIDFLSGTTHRLFGHRVVLPAIPAWMLD